MDIGMPELIVILVIALVLFGGGKLPEVGRSLGSAIREFKSAMREVSDSADIKTASLPEAKTASKETKEAKA